MDASEAIDADKHRVNAELNALKSSNKIQNMFRINKSKSSANSPKLDHVDLDEKVMEDVQKSRSNITNMFESLGPKMTFGGGTPKTEKPAPPKPKVEPEKTEKTEEGELQGRKWVFDTIQKYFDVIVEESEEGEEDEEDEDDGEEEGEESESDYTSADEEIPEVVLPPASEKLANRSLTSSASPILKEVLGKINNLFFIYTFLVPLLHFPTNFLHDT